MVLFGFSKVFWEPPADDSAVFAEGIRQQVPRTCLVIKTPDAVSQCCRRHLGDPTTAEKSKRCNKHCNKHCRKGRNGGKGRHLADAMLLEGCRIICSWFYLGFSKVFWEPPADDSAVFAEGIR